MIQTVMGALHPQLAHIILKENLSTTSRFASRHESVAMKIMDTLIKRVEAAGFIKLVPKYSDARSHCLTFVSDGRDRVQVSVIEKTARAENPAWNRDNWPEIRYGDTPTGHLSRRLLSRFGNRWTSGINRGDRPSRVVSVKLKVKESKRKRIAKTEHAGGALRWHAKSPRTYCQ